MLFLEYSRQTSSHVLTSKYLDIAFQQTKQKENKFRARMEKYIIFLPWGFSGEEKNKHCRQITHKSFSNIKLQLMEKS